MGKERVALTQPERTRRDVQKTRNIARTLAVERGDRGRVVACVKGKDVHPSVSFRARANDPRIPFAKDTVSASSYLRSSSTHSLIATPVGTSST